MKSVGGRNKVINIATWRIKLKRRGTGYPKLPGTLAKQKSDRVSFDEKKEVLSTKVLDAREKVRAGRVGTLFHPDFSDNYRAVPGLGRYLGRYPSPLAN